jgi:drug/metabolite transporter (DMT)-like permease
MGYLKAQTVAILTYIDPIVAVFLSALFLQEPLAVSTIIGAVLILGSTLISELRA